MAYSVPFKRWTKRPHTLQILVLSILSVEQRLVRPVTLRIQFRIRHKAEGGGVDTVTKSVPFHRPIGENVFQMGVRFSAPHFFSHHEMGEVKVFRYGVIRNRFGKGLLKNSCQLFWNGVYC